MLSFDSGSKVVSLYRHDIPYFDLNTNSMALQFVSLRESYLYTSLKGSFDL